MNQKQKRNKKIHGKGGNNWDRVKDLAWGLVFEQKTNKGNTNTILSNPQLTEGGGKGKRVPLAVS